MTEQIVERPIGELLPYAQNPRTHSEAQIESIARSIEEFGFNNPILVDSEGGIIAGHGRLLAAQKLGRETVPTLELPHLSDAQKRAYVIADNQIALTAAWDFALLASQIETLAQDGLDVTVLGFTSGDLDLIERLGAGAIVNDPNQEWQGLPSCSQDDKTAFRQVLVSFRSQDDIDRFTELTGLTLTPQTRFTWWPPAEIDHTNRTHSYASDR